MILVTLKLLLLVVIFFICRKMENYIEIVYYSEPIDNFGRTESSSKGEIIFAVLNDVDNWSDDMKFETKDGNILFIDDLQGKDVFLKNIGIFCVPKED